MICSSVFHSFHLSSCDGPHSFLDVISPPQGSLSGAHKLQQPLPEATLMKVRIGSWKPESDWTNDRRGLFMDAVMIRGSRPFMLSVAAAYILSDHNAEKQNSALNLFPCLSELKLCSEATLSDLCLFFGVADIWWQGKEESVPLPAASKHVQMFWRVHRPLDRLWTL